MGGPGLATAPRAATRAVGLKQAWSSRCNGLRSAVRQAERGHVGRRRGGAASIPAAACPAGADLERGALSGEPEMDVAPTVP